MVSETRAGRRMATGCSRQIVAVLLVQALTITKLDSAGRECMPIAAPANRSRPWRAPAGGSAAALENGGTQIRTGDTTIFSRVLYQLSYPAGARER